MSEYIISSKESGSKDKPFQLEPDTSGNTTTAITSINLGGCFVNMGHIDGGYNSFWKLDDNSYNYLSALTSIENGTILNESGTSMFSNCSLSTVDVELPNLTDGNSMFYENKLTNWNIDLPNLTYGQYMFLDNPMESFNGNLDNLQNGMSMFYENKLKSWTTELPNLSNGDFMFQRNDIVSWNIPLPNITNCRYMFYQCTALTSFETTMNNITSSAQCSNMFQKCSSALKNVTIHTTLTSSQYNNIFTKKILGLTGTASACTLTVDNNV